jgi:mannose-1-phosphate guanylyltransferase/phosphomannomutase
VLAQDPQTERVRQIDGVKHQNDGEWVLVLPDADRPLFNIYAEARDEGRAWTLAQEYAERVEHLRAGA